MTNNNEQQENETVELLQNMALLRKVTRETIKREIAMLNLTSRSAREKMTVILTRADENLIAWIYEKEVTSWTGLERAAENIGKNENKENDVIAIMKMKRQMDEDPITYAEKMIKQAKQKYLSENTIIALLANNVWQVNTTAQMHISTATSSEDALQRISQLKLNMALLSRRKNNNMRRKGTSNLYCTVCKRQGHAKEKCFFKPKEDTPN